MDIAINRRSAVELEVYSERTQNTMDIERHRKLEFRAGGAPALRYYT